MDYKRVIEVGIVLGLLVLLSIFGLSQEFPPDFDLPDPPAFPGAEGDGPGSDSPPPDKFPDAPPAFPAAAASPPAARAALPGDISGPDGVPDGRCVNLYDIWAMGPQLGVCQLPAGSPLDVDGDSCFTEADVPTIMQNVNVRCS